MIVEREFVEVVDERSLMYSAASQLPARIQQVVEAKALQGFALGEVSYGVTVAPGDRPRLVAGALLEFTRDLSPESMRLPPGPENWRPESMAKTVALAPWLVAFSRYLAYGGMLVGLWVLGGLVVELALTLWRHLS